MRMVKPFWLGVLLLVGAAHAPAMADPTPSADQIINSLATTDSSKPCAAGCRGIHAIAPNAADGTAPAASAPQAGTGSGMIDLSVQFATGSAALTPSATRVLRHLGQALTSPRLAANRFRIEGHTDTVGDADTNQKLSEARAASAATFLEQTFNIDPGRLETVGLGEKDLAVQTPDNTPEPRNRRVHVVNLGS